MRKLEQILAIPLLIALGLWAINALTNPGSPEVIEQGGELIAQAAVPWWISVLEFLTSIPGIGAILGVVFLFFLFSKSRGSRW